jgi:hypothetical protein
MVKSPGGAGEGFLISVHNAVRQLNQIDCAGTT